MNAANKPIVCLALRPPADVLARIERECEARLVADPSDRAALLAALDAAEGLLCSALLPIDAEALAAAPRLRVIANFGVGFDNVDLAEATARGVAVCNTPDVLSDAVADLTMALILALSRRLVDNALFVREGRWGGAGPGVPLGVDLRDKAIGVVGLGRIGRAVAKRARAFGMRVLYHDVFRQPPEGAAFCSYRDLDTLLRESDFVTLHVNLTLGTRHLIGARELSLMKPSAYLVNTARGPIVDQAALCDALQRGAIAGAALDVLEREPPAGDDPILSAPNVLILPHVGSATRETRAAMMDLAVRNLLAVVRGEPPLACVNPEALDRRSWEGEGDHA